MARITAGVTTSHVPAIGAALDNGRASEPYWQPVFAGFDFSKEWIAQQKPDVILLVYNDHATAFSLDIVPTFAMARPPAINRRTKVGGPDPCQSSRGTQNWRRTSPNR